MVASTLVPPASSERTPYGPGLLEGSPGRRRGLGAHAQGRTEDGCTDRQECSVQPRGNRLIRRHRAARRGRTLYLLDEPTTGLHPADEQLLMGQLNRLVDAANTVIVVEHHMDVVAAADWVIDCVPLRWFVVHRDGILNMYTFNHGCNVVHKVKTNIRRTPERSAVPRVRVPWVGSRPLQSGRCTRSERLGRCRSNRSDFALYWSYPRWFHSK